MIKAHERRLEQIRFAQCDARAPTGFRVLACGQTTSRLQLDTQSHSEIRTGRRATGRVFRFIMAPYTDPAKLDRALRRWREPSQDDALSEVFDALNLGGWLSRQLPR